MINKIAGEKQCSCGSVRLVSRTPLESPKRILSIVV
jgi:hypothetical protein